MEISMYLPQGEGRGEISRQETGVIVNFAN